MVHKLKAITKKYDRLLQKTTVRYIFLEMGCNEQYFQIIRIPVCKGGDMDGEF